MSLKNNPSEEKYHDIFLTDIQMHVAEPRKPLPWYRAVMKSLRSKKPGRFFTKDFSMKEEKGNFTGTFRCPLPEKIVQEIKEAEAAGKKIRFIYPKEGIPVYAGKDVKEFLRARNKKHLTDIPKELK